MSRTTAIIRLSFAIVSLVFSGITGLQAAEASNQESVQAIGTEIVAYGELQATPSQPERTLKRRVQELFEESVWTFTADGTVTVVPGVRADVAYGALEGRWELNENETVSFEVSAGWQVGNTGLTEVIALGTIGTLDDGRLAAYVIYQASSSTSVVILKQGYGTTTSRTYEFIVALE
ncbi:MAG: hypothetical protein IT336_08835 [Thermomicrobiales bacterium]|nr:hypothetical protein [Thermomicrobiales bacterium]